MVAQSLESLRGGHEAGTCWEVVGGTTSGGIIVRTRSATSSKQRQQRLATGSLVRVLDADGAVGRIHFELLKGVGPARGWISTHFQGKALLLEATADSSVDKVALIDSLRVDGEMEPSEFESGPRMPRTLVQGELERDLGLAADRETEFSLENSVLPKHGGDLAFEEAEDSDGEQLHMCSHCHLPLGEGAYCRDGKYVHGECIAQLMVQDVRSEAEIRQKKVSIQKSQLRAEFDIGWTAAHIPSNDGLAKKLIGRDISGMVCLTLDEGTKSVSIEATSDEAASVNLEYLSIALQVRRQEGHEPVFSLDPINAKDRNTMQEKVFVPQWLAGTSVGEVLFQADYLLKELSMGEHSQPVLGMNSCFDYSEEEVSDEPWNAREWFMVRKAEVQLSDGHVLVPRVKLGVEARAQSLGSKGLEDAPITRSDHPMVRYAEAFTHNFDLIAERISVIHHLRELAKAAVLAKFLLDCGIPLQDEWFHLAEGSRATCSFGWEVPQLWNERVHSNIRVEDGTLLNAARQKRASMHGIFGGVNLALEAFDFASSIAARLGQRIGHSPMLPPTGMMPSDSLDSEENLTAGDFDLAASIAAGIGRRPFTVTRQPIAAVAPALGRLKFIANAPRLDNRLMPPSHYEPQDQLDAQPIAATFSLLDNRLAMQLHGVDLRLDQFDLSTTTQVSAEISQLESSAVGFAFWHGIDDINACVSQDQLLLRHLFNADLSDRRMEDHFVPPCLNSSYNVKLCGLLKEEASIRQQRKGHFYSKAFAMSDPSVLFPASWSASLEEARRRGPSVLLEERAYTAEPLLVSRLKSAQPVFDNSTEDGTRFRIYELGGLEVRTTHEVDGNEEVGVVFSVGRTSHLAAGSLQCTNDPMKRYGKIMKVTEYVEAYSNDVNASEYQKNGEQLRQESSRGRQHFIVVEVDLGHQIITELLSDGTVTWQENAANIEARIIPAKALRSSNSRIGVVLEDFKNFRSTLVKNGNSSKDFSGSARKHYARAAYNTACGKLPDTTSTKESLQGVWTGVSRGSQSDKSSLLLQVERKPSPYQVMASCFKG